MGKIFLITGMHRSGTSLFASILKKCGLDIGKNLMPSDIGNKRGYFEDQDFVNFHNQILKENNKHYFFKKSFKSLKINSQFRNRSVKLLQKNQASNKAWAWKDPRSVLFLNFWESMIGNNLYYILIFRHPYLVFDSLIRRNTDPDIKRHNIIAFKSWLIYNEKILSFLRNKNEKKYLLIEIDDFINNPDPFLFEIKKKFDLNIKLTDYKKLIHKEELNQKNPNLNNRWFQLRQKNLAEKCMIMYDDLIKLKFIP